MVRSQRNRLFFPPSGRGRRAKSAARSASPREAQAR